MRDFIVLFFSVQTFMVMVKTLRFISVMHLKKRRQIFQEDKYECLKVINEMF